MRLVDLTLGRLASRDWDRRPGMVYPRGWLRRHWLVSSLVVVALVAALLVWWRPWQQCGPGLTAVGSPGTCVGLDLESRGFGDDRLADLIASMVGKNPARAEDVATIVLLDDMTPDATQDTDKLPSLRHRIQGAMTAVWRANEAGFAGNLPKLRLLLASYGAKAQHWQEAVEAVKQARVSENIVAVTGIGQSLEETRQAAAALSDAKIAVVGSVVTADNMNLDLEGNLIQRFVRVAPLNSHQAQAAFTYITKKGSYNKVMLVHDENPKDSYSQTLAEAFQAAYWGRHQQDVPYTEPYLSPDDLVEVRRDEYMAQQFAKMHGDLCKIKPDLVYFAGRGADLKSFLHALFDSGACGLNKLDIVTGDSAAFLIDEELPSADHLKLNVYYTALAHVDQWAKEAEEPGALDIVKRNQANYQKFEEAFVSEKAYQFVRADLVDSYAMMSHDAVLVAVKAVRSNRDSLPELGTVADQFPHFRCRDSIPGASGTIYFDDRGNPVNKPMPILQVKWAEGGKGYVEQVDLAWPRGEPSDPEVACP